MRRLSSPPSLVGPWKLMPRIEIAEGIRIPRAASYTQERDSGRAIVALHWAGLKTAGKPRVFLRNVHRRHCSDELRIENMREFDGLWNRLRVHKTKKTNVFLPATRMRKSRFTPWTVLQARGWKMVAEPFMLEAPMHNCMIEMALSEFKALHATHRKTERNSVEAFNAGMADETPMARLIRQHYEEAGVLKGWNPERVNRLAQAWGMSVRELARYILCPPGRIEDFVSGLGIELPGSVMLLLFYMERLVEEQVLGRRFELPMFPQLPKAV